MGVNFLWAATQWPSIHAGSAKMSVGSHDHYL